MPLALIKVFIAGASFILGFVFFFGFFPEALRAPSEFTPALIEKPIEETMKTEATSSSAASIPEPEERDTNAPPVSPQPSAQPTLPTPALSDYEKSLREALEALERIEAERAALEDSTDVNAITRSAVVNILCTTTGGGSLNPISASGVVIDPRGVILTNAHVGQYFLLKDYLVPGFVNCIIRTGSPAYPAYTASLLFLPPSWIAKNAEKIDDQRPTGNGEHDWALVLITGAINGGALPALPALPLVTESPAPGEAVLVAGYPAGFLGSATILRDLYAVSANATIGGVYTYGTNMVDLFSLGGTIVAQQGSSGGAVATPNASSASKVALTGLIVTSSDAPDTGSRDLRALSTEYIIRDFAMERGIPLVDFLTRDLALEQRLFEQNTAPTLAAQLVDVLER